MPSGNLIAAAEWNGHKGLVSNLIAHDADPQSFSVFLDILNDVSGRRHKRPGTGLPVSAVAAGAEVGNMHAFVKTDATTGVQSWTVLRGAGTSLERWTGAAWAALALGGLAAFTGSEWRFANFRNRVYIVNGVDGLFWYDGTAGLDGREVFRGGIATPSTAIGYSVTAVDAPYTTGSVTATKGSKLVIGSGATTWVTTGAWSDKYIDIAGVRYQIDTVTVAAPGQLLLKDAYRGETLAGLVYAIYYGLADWTEPPVYTYAYINETTGHVSNVGPLLTLNERDSVSKTVRLTAIPYSTTDYNNGYLKIQIFRSAKNGTVPVAIDAASGGRINNSNVAGTTTFTETLSTYRDVNLTQFPAPIISNERPLNNAGTGTPALSAIAEWNGRLWVLSPRDAKAFYSGSTAEIEFGLAAECWPSINFLPIDDGKGLLRVGDGNRNSFLLIQTGAEERLVTGSDVRDYDSPELAGGRNVGGNALQAISVGGTLVQFYADKRLIDYGSNDTPEGDIGRRIQDKLNSIPDAYLTSVRLAWFSFSDRSLLFLSAPKQAGSVVNDVTYVYDRDNDCWSEWSIGFSSFAVVKNLTTGKRELWGARPTSRKVYKLLQPATWQDDGGNFTPSMKSQWLRPFGYGKAGLWKWFAAWVNDAVPTWQLKTRINTDAGTIVTMDLAARDFRFDSGNGLELGTAPADAQKQRAEVHQFELVWPTTATELWVDKMRATMGLDQDVEETP